MEARRKSLLIGINYTGSDNELRGCVQDVENVLEFLDWDVNSINLIDCPGSQSY